MVHSAQHRDVRARLSITLALAHAEANFVPLYRSSSHFSDSHEPGCASTAEGVMAQAKIHSEAGDPILRRLADVAERTRNAVVIGDPEGCIDWVNDGFTALTGYGSDEMVGRRIESLLDLHEPSIHLILERLTRGEGSRAEFSFHTRDGQERWVDLEVEPIRDEDGAQNGFMAMASDVTERKQADLEHLASEERYQFLLEMCPDPIAVHQNGRLVFVNPACATLFGVESPTELVDRSILDFVHPDSRDAVHERIQKMLEVGEPAVLMENRFLRVDGGEVVAEVAGAPIRYQGKPAIQVVMRDATDRLNAEKERRERETQEQEKQRLESLAVLSTGMAHDFNNRLSAILGNTDLALLDLATDAPVARKLREIRRDALSAAELTEQMLAYAGQAGFNPKPLDISALVLGMSQSLDVLARGEVSLNYDLAGNLPPVSGDANLLRQVVRQLVRNGLDALEGKPGVVNVRTLVRSMKSRQLRGPGIQDLLPAEPYLSLSVQDTGCGMDRLTRRRIFEPFFSSRFAGRGLGLAAVLGSARRHGGGVLVESEPGKGSTVSVLLPISRDLDDSRWQRPQRPSELPQRMILIVEAEDAVRRVAQEALERFGYEVLTARRGEEALDTFRRHARSIGCVLLELTLPGMSGEDLYREILQIRPETRVILTSGYRDESAVERMERAGDARYLAKPYLPSVLAGMVRDTVGPALRER